MVEYELCEIQDLSQGKFEPKFGVRCPGGEIISVSGDKSRAVEIVDILNDYAVCDCHIRDVICDFIYESGQK